MMKRGVCEQVEAVVKCQARIQYQLKLESSRFTKVWFNLRKVFTKERNRTLEELFWVQEDNLQDLNISLNENITDTRSELTSLQNYLSKIENNIIQNSKNVSGLEKQIVKEKLTTNSLREIDELKHKLGLQSEKVVEMKSEYFFVEGMEEVLRNSVQYSERLYQKMQQMETHVRNTRKIIQRVSEHTQLNELLYEAVAVTNQYVLDLHNSLQLPEFKKIKPVSYKSPNTYEIQEKIKEIKRWQHHNARNYLARLNAEQEVRRL
ncbi:MAG: hypothetical protein ABIF40_00055 [archaeon]